MSQITKKVDRGVTAAHRTQVFTQADASAGDILLIQTSLGKPARTISIQAVGAMTVRFNVLRTIYPNRDSNAWNSPYGPMTKNLALGEEVEDTTQSVLTIDANTTFSLQNEIPVQDIKIVSAAGNWEIFVA